MTINQINALKDDIDEIRTGFKRIPHFRAVTELNDDGSSSSFEIDRFAYLYNGGIVVAPVQLAEDSKAEEAWQPYALVTGTIIVPEAFDSRNGAYNAALEMIEMIGVEYYCEASHNAISTHDIYPNADSKDDALVLFETVEKPWITGVIKGMVFKRAAKE